MTSPVRGQMAAGVCHGLPLVGQQQLAHGCFLSAGTTLPTRMMARLGLPRRMGVLAPRSEVGRRRPASKASRRGRVPTRRRPPWVQCCPEEVTAGDRPRQQSRTATPSGRRCGIGTSGPPGSGPSRRPGDSTTSPCSAAMWSGPSPSTRTCWSSPWPSCSRTGTTAAPPTSSSTSATATTWPTSTSPASTSAPTARCSEVSTTSPSRSPPGSGTVWWPRWRRPVSPPTSSDGTSAYFPGPDGERLELLSYPLNDMYGTIVGEVASP